MVRKTLFWALIVGFLVAVLSLTSCIPTTDGGGTEGQNSVWTMVIFIVVLFGLMYLVMIRPQRKRQKEHQQLVEELKRGDKVMTAGGIYGTIESVAEDSIVLKVESGTTIRVAKGSVIGKRAE